jgi:hypothetical protein
VSFIVYLNWIFGPCQLTVWLNWIQPWVTAVYQNWMFELCKSLFSRIRPLITRFYLNFSAWFMKNVVLFAHTKMKLWNKWHFVENKREIMQHVLKCSEFLLTKCIKCISMGVLYMHCICACRSFKDRCFNYVGRCIAGLNIKLCWSLYSYR